METTCECGCGQPTRISEVTERAKGWVKGEPRRYVLGHWARGKTGPQAPHWGGELAESICQCGCAQVIPPKPWHRQRKPIYIRGHQPASPPPRVSVPADVQARTGICECGCGERTALATTTSPSSGAYLGYPARFVHGHRIRLGKGSNSPRWKGGRVQTTGGHVLVYRPDHPHANRHGQVLEHRLVAEQLLGRWPRWFGPSHPESEVVHHLNHDKTDNRPENLVVLSIAEHHRTHTVPAATAARVLPDNDRTPPRTPSRCRSR